MQAPRHVWGYPNGGAPPPPPPPRRLRSSPMSDTRRDRGVSYLGKGVEGPGMSLVTEGTENHPPMLHSRQNGPHVDHSMVDQRSNGPRRVGSEWKRHGGDLHHGWRGATESRVNDQPLCGPAVTFNKVSHHSTSDRFFSDFRNSNKWTSLTPGFAEQDANGRNDISPKQGYNLYSQTTRASTFGNRVQSQHPQPKQNSSISNTRHRGSRTRMGMNPLDLHLRTDTIDTSTSVGIGLPGGIQHRKRGGGGGETGWSDRQNVNSWVGTSNLDVQQRATGVWPNSSSVPESQSLTSTNSNHAASGVQVIRPNAVSPVKGASFFHSVNFGHSDSEFFATSQAGCFYHGINRELERNLLKLSEQQVQGEAPSKLVRLADETDERWAARLITPPKSVVLGPAHQFFCSLHGKSPRDDTISTRSENHEAQNPGGAQPTDIDSFLNGKETAFFRCNSGSTSLLEQIQKDPLAVEFLTFGFKPDSYVCLTTDQMYHNRLPPDMVQTMQGEAMDVEAVQLWKGDGWFIRDSDDNIYFNNISDATLLDIFSVQHPDDPVDCFSISLNGLNWYVRTASGTEFYKSSMLKNIQRKYDAQFPDAAYLVRDTSRNADQDKYVDTTDD
eukprot:GHVN01080473.1.p1 GENE.GHVN01080473.1~~GHVN01080473.1.p1  ORF type:complete len:612 (+),score=65.83 GHVN01080473.1:78-1913(+)